MLCCLKAPNKNLSNSTNCDKYYFSKNYFFFSFHGCLILISFFHPQSPDAVIYSHGLSVCLSSEISPQNTMFVIICDLMLLQDYPILIQKSLNSLFILINTIMFIVLGFVDVKYFLQQSRLVIFSSLPFLHILIEQKLFLLQQTCHHVGGIGAKHVF